jgi:4-hydroxybenzoate polyprenyltransferase
MYWWQWVLQITGAWFYLGLLVAWIWSVVLSQLRARDNAREEHFRHAA